LIEEFVGLINGSWLKARPDIITSVGKKRGPNEEKRGVGLKNYYFSKKSVLY